MLRNFITKIPNSILRNNYKQQKNLMHSNSSLNHLIKSIEELCPLSLAEKSWDNVGLMIESPLIREIKLGLKKRIVCCIDCMCPVLPTTPS